MKRVKQISIDILVDDEKDGCILAEQIARDLENEGNIVLGASFQDDLTELYKRDYLELLGEEEEEKNENWGEEICPHCDHVNDFVWEEGTPRRIECKNCGNEILLCSLCNMDEVDCHECPYVARFNVYAINKVKKHREMLVYSAQTKNEAEEFCESWGWNYDDGTKSYWLEIVKC